MYLKEKIASLLIVISVFISIGQVNAQKLSLVGGINYSQLKYEYKIENYCSNFGEEFGFQMGLRFNCDIGSSYDLSVATLLQKAGLSHTKSSDIEFSNFVEIEAELYYFSLPILVRKSFKIRNTTIFIEMGPYGNIGVHGNHETFNYRDDELMYSTSSRVHWGNSIDDAYKLLDFGWDFGLGGRYKNLNYGLSYELGLRNVLNQEDVSQKNRYFSLWLEYPIWNKRII